MIYRRHQPRFGFSGGVSVEIVGITTAGGAGGGGSGATGCGAAATTGSGGGAIGVTASNGAGPASNEVRPAGMSSTGISWTGI